MALFRRIRRPVLGGLASAATALIFLAPPVYSITTYYPHLLSNYSESVGGLPGATWLGLETTYWCETYREAIQFINEKAKPGDSIWAEWYSVDALVYYQLHGFLRKDLRLSVDYNYWPIFGPGIFFPQVRHDFTDSDFVIFTYRQPALVIFKGPSSTTTTGNQTPYIPGHPSARPPTGWSAREFRSWRFIGNREEAREDKPNPLLNNN
jgi:hypothetical protein